MDQVNLIKISNLDYLNNSKFLKKKTWHTIKYKRFFKFFKKTVFLFFFYYIFLYFKKNSFFFKIHLLPYENGLKKKKITDYTNVQFKFFFLNMKLIGHLYFFLGKNNSAVVKSNSFFYGVIKKKNYLVTFTYNSYLKKLLFFKV